MDDSKKILEEKMEDYHIERHKFETYLNENKDDFQDTLKYAKYLKEPVKEKQVLFWCKGQKECADVPRYIFDELYRRYGDGYTYVWVVKTNKNLPKGLPQEVTFVKKNSSVYWEALACSKYLIGNVALPAIFYKRKEQVYVNSMLGMDAFFQKRSSIGADAHSLMWKEMVKTDYLISDSEWMTKKVYEEEYQLLGVYQGGIITVDNLRAAYMKKRACEKNEIGRCLFLIKEKENYQCFEEHMDDFFDLPMDVTIMRDQNCAFQGQELCDFIAQCDLLISDGSNYMRDAHRYGCKVCSWGGGTENYLGFEEFDIVDTLEGLKDYITQNVDFRRKDVEINTDGIRQIVDVVFENQTDHSVVYRMPISTKKKLLILTDWTMPREQKYMMKCLLPEFDKEVYDLTVAAPLAGNPYYQKEMDELPDHIRKIAYRGRMILNREEYIFFKLIQKNLNLYANYAEICHDIKVIMQREWERMWGAFDADCIILFGDKAKQYFLTAAQTDVSKILAAENFMQNEACMEPETCQNLLEIFEYIYVPATSTDSELDIYGEKNKDKIKRIPLQFLNRYVSADAVEYLQMGGKEYMVAERWRCDDESQQVQLVRLPTAKSCIINAQAPLGEEEKTQLKAFLEGKEDIWIFGEHMEEYKNVIKQNVTVMSNFIREKLYMLPTAKVFFERIGSYYGNKDLKFDAMAEICKRFHVEEEI